MIGRIQLGALDARYPYVIEPAVPEGVPAAGIAPIEPACVVTPGVVVVELLLLLLLLLHAARAVTPATARASPPRRLVPESGHRPPLLAPFAARGSVLGSSAWRPSLSQVAR